MGETQKQPFQLSFNSSLMVDFQGARVTSDGGLILVRELDVRLGLSELMERHLTDSRRGKNTQLPLIDLLRQSVYSRLAGYEDVNDAERVSQDPTFRLIGSKKIWERGAALTSRLQSFETKTADARRKSRRSGHAQPGVDRQSGSYRFAPTGGAGHGQHRDPGLRPARGKAPTTDTSSLPIITRCCCSIAKATAWRRNCVLATSTVPIVERNCCCLRSSANSGRART